MTFCLALGAEEANRQLRRHWATWVTEENIEYMATHGLDSVRIPVGDWMYAPYEPYIGCMDGARDELERVLRLCEKHGLKVILDVHAMRGSQNGLDNSGNTGHMKWIKGQTDNLARYRHWDIRGGDWVGHFNDTTKMYDSVNMTNIEHSLHVVREIVKAHKDDPVLAGLEPVNEPWWPTPLDVLKQYYWDSYQIVQESAPHWVTLLHDSFRLNPDVWGNFMVNCKNYAIDTHIYQAWSWPMDSDWYEEHACSDGDNLRLMESIGVPIIVGEWSLATDNCAMWLNGLNDNVPGYPKVECERVQCPPPYMGSEQPGAPPDPSLGKQDPIGMGGESYVLYGTCPRDKPFPNNNDVIMKNLGYSKLNAFDYRTHGQFFWNFRTEFEPRWDFIQASGKGWLASSFDEAIVLEIASYCPRPKNAAPTPSPTLSPPSTNSVETATGTISSTTSSHGDNNVLQFNNNSHHALTSFDIFVILVSVLLATGAAFLWVFRRAAISRAIAKRYQYTRIPDGQTKPTVKDKQVFQIEETNPQKEFNI